MTFNLRYFKKKSDRYASAEGSTGPDPAPLELETKQYSLGWGGGVIFSTLRTGRGRPLEARFLIQQAVSGSGGWTPKVLAVSALTGEGVPTVWDAVLEHHEVQQASGALEARRRTQACAWLWRLLDEGLEAAFRADPTVAELLPQLEKQVDERVHSAPEAARILLEKFRR